MRTNDKAAIRDFDFFLFFRQACDVPRRSDRFRRISSRVARFVSYFLSLSFTFFVFFFFTQRIETRIDLIDESFFSLGIPSLTFVTHYFEKSDELFYRRGVLAEYAYDTQAMGGLSVFLAILQGRKNIHREAVTRILICIICTYTVGDRLHVKLHGHADYDIFVWHTHANRPRTSMEGGEGKG